MIPAGRTVADALAQVLDNWGLEALFGVSGANIEDLHDAVHRLDGGLRSIAARSENGAAFMADAHARIHGTLGLCCATSGGGMMNLAVGVAESRQSGVPVLAIVGQVPTALEGVGGFQDSSGLGDVVDAEALWAAIAKDVCVLRSGHVFWTVLRRLVSAAVNGRQGPSVLLVPKDVFSHPVPAQPNDWPRSPMALRTPLPPSTGMLQDVVGALQSARRPVIVAGPGVRRAGASASLLSFAEHTSIPVVTTMEDTGAFPGDHPLAMGIIGTAGHPSAHRYLNDHADLVLVLGSALEIMVRAPIRATLDHARIIVVDPAPQRAAAALPQSDVHCADLDLALQALCLRTDLAAVGPGRPTDYRVTRFLPSVVESHQDVALADGDLLQSEAIQMLAERALPRAGHLLFDAGNCAASALHYMTTPQQLTTTIALGMGGMGYAVAGAVGAQLGAADGERTVVLCGDGAFLMLGMELHTAVELGLPILFVVFNNAGHGMCVTRQQRFFGGRVEASRYPAASFVEIARGLAGHRSMWAGAAATPVELDAALDSLEAWDGQGPALLELVIQREEMPPFTPFLPADAPEGDLPTPSFARASTARGSFQPNAA